MKVRNVIKKITLLLVLITAALTIHAQQQSQFSQYMLNYYMVNPAVSGTEDFIDIKASYRQQWAGIEGAPKNYYVSAHAPIGKLHGAHNGKRANKQMLDHHSVGGLFSGQTTGQLSRVSGYASYAYHLPLDPKHYLSLGIMAGAIQYSLNPVFGSAQSKDDDAINAANFSSIVPDGSIGLWFYSNDYFAGISTTQMFDSKLNSDVPDNLNATLNRHYYLAGGYGIKLNKETKVIPSTLIKYSNSVLQVDLNAKIKYDGKLWGGVSYRNKDAIVFLAGVLIAKQVEVGVSYDVTVSNLKSYAGPTYEFVLGYRLNQLEGIISPSDFW